MNPPAETRKPALNAADLEAIIDVPKLARLLNFNEDDLREIFLSRQYSSTLPKLLASLRKTGYLNFKSESERERLAQDGDAALEKIRVHRERLREYVWADTSCRMFINSLLVSAVGEVQQHQQSTPIGITTSTGTRSTLPTDHFVIEQDYVVSAEIAVPPIEYAVLVVDEETYEEVLKRKKDTPPPAPEYALLAIAEAEGPLTFETARARIEAQCLAMLKATNRPTFPGLFSNGLIWHFYLAVANDTAPGAAPAAGVTIYESLPMCTDLFHPPRLPQDDETESPFESPTDERTSDDALVVGTLLELLRHPGRVPPAFELRVKDY